MSGEGHVNKVFRLEIDESRRIDRLHAGWVDGVPLIDLDELLPEVGTYASYTVSKVINRQSAALTRRYVWSGAIDRMHGRLELSVEEFIKVSV